MRRILVSFYCIFFLSAGMAPAQGTVPTFAHPTASGSYTLVGGDPSQASTTVLPVTLVPVTLVFESQGSPAVHMSAAPDVRPILASPLFSPFAFGPGNRTQYGDAMMRATFPAAKNWHVLLDKPAVNAVTISIPAAYGYVLTSKKNGGSLGVVDADFLEDKLFQKLPREKGKLLIAVTHNTTFYADHDATICCTWGTHGIDKATRTSFVLGSYLDHPPAIVTDADVQPLTEQLAEFFIDPRHDPQTYGYGVTGPGNKVPSWMRADARLGCGGNGIGSDYFLLDPTDTNLKNNIPAGPSYLARTGGAAYHLQDVALLPWYLGTSAAQPLSFPDTAILSKSASPCAHRSTVAAYGNRPQPLPAKAPGQHHQLIGYWTGRGPGGTPFPLHDISPQWDVIIVAFAAPVKNAPEGTLAFHLPGGLDESAFKSDLTALKKSGRKVMLSLGGGGAYFTLNSPASIPTFVSGVASIIKKYGFDGVDIDFESPSLVLQPGDTDPRHPTTPSILNLISGLRQLHNQFGPTFMISLVPEGPQIPAGYLTYGGQFGSYLPLIEGLRDILSFVDVQDYNTPPLEGLDDEIYQAHTVDYHAALTELQLRGFAVAGNPAHFFKPLAPKKIAVGFLTDYDTPGNVSGSIQYILNGHEPADVRYRLRDAEGYPAMLGAMFWTIDDDRQRGYSFSNILGPQLHQQTVK